MKKSELKQIIKEEIRKVLKEEEEAKRQRDFYKDRGQTSLPIDNVVGRSEQLCDHPTNKRASFKSHGKDFCWKCGKHIEA